MQEISNIINSVKEKLIVDGIKYTKLGKGKYYSQKLFETEEIFGYLNDNLIPSQRGLFDHVVFDSNVEERFVKDLENDERVKLYVKFLPATKLDDVLNEI